MAKAASKRPVAKAKPSRPAKASGKSVAVKPAPKPVAVKAKAPPVKAMPGKAMPAKAQPAKAPPPPAKPLGKANGVRAASPEAAKKLGSIVGRTPPPAPAPRPVVNSEAMMASPVPTNNKPKKNQAGLTSKELEHFRDLLLAKRGEIVGDMSAMEREALRTSGGSNLSTLPIHMADMGTDNYEQEFTLGLVETERKLLREINHALAKIQNGTYGICEGNGKPISKVRLEVQPWARYSIDYAKQMERGGR